MAMVIGLGTRLHAHKIRNSILHNRQQPGSAMNSFFDPVYKFEAMGLLSGLKLRTVTSINFMQNSKRITEMALHYLCLAVFHEAFGQLYEPC